MKVHKKKLKSLKMDAVSESRQGPLAAANFVLNVAKVNLAATKDLRIKRKLEQPEPTRYSKKPFSLQRIYAVLTRQSTKPQAYKRGSSNHFERRRREKMARNHFQREKHLENHISLRILRKIEGSKPRIQASTRISALFGHCPAISYQSLSFSAFF